MPRSRHCGKQCHAAKGDKCRCWCGGAFHGPKGAALRQALEGGKKELLEEHGYVEGATHYIKQAPLRDPHDLPG